MLRTAPVFALGFRPFYLLAALMAALDVPLWLAQYAGWAMPSGYLSGMAWHAHEMMFGFAAAVLTGFLFTAARNWTGLPTPTGAALAALAALWLAARVLLLSGPGWLAAIVDVAFLPAVAASLWLPLRRSRNRNQFFVALLLALATANLLFHLAHAEAIALSELVPLRFALYLIVVIVAIMGGRVIPSFTQNAIRGARIRRWRALDIAAIATLAVALAAALAGLPGLVSGPLCLLAAALHAARLAMWDPWSTRGEPILWILHLSYAWIPVALLLLGVAALGGGVPAVLADHALGLGVVGGMILGMITRTARGHTGRSLQPGRTEVAAYALVAIAAATRVLVPLVWPGAYRLALLISGALWSAAFLLYLLVYVPMLTQPRADGQGG
jgi:uncharacterized protein involved in response to NO